MVGQYIKPDINQKTSYDVGFKPMFYTAVDFMNHSLLYASGSQIVLIRRAF